MALMAALLGEAAIRAPRQSATIARRWVTALILGWTPFAMWLLIKHFDWSWWYLMDEHRAAWATRSLPILVEVMVGISVFHAIRTMRIMPVRYVAIAILLVATLLLLILPFPYYSVVTTNQLWPEGPRIWEDGRFLLELAIGFGWVGIWYIRAALPFFRNDISTGD